jgi:hypothetical protein
MLSQIIQKQKILYIYNIFYIYSKNITNMTKLVYDLEDIKKNVLHYKKKLHALTIIQEGDKISFDVDNNVYIDYNNSFQSIKRWYYCENRIVTYDKLSLLFDDYNKLLLMIYHSIYNEKNIEYYKIVDDILLFNKQVIIGLLNLKKTYSKDNNNDNKIKEITSVIIEYIKQMNNRYIICKNNVII